MIVDSGRDLFLPRELLAGRVLYRDVFYHHGPLPPHLNAALYAAFGDRLQTLVAAGLAVAAGAAGLLYAVARRGLPAWGAALAAATFLYDCAFGRLSTYGSYNFVLPYSWAATYGLLAALVSLWGLLRRAEGGGPGALLAAGAGLAAAALCKIEIAAAGPGPLIHGNLLIANNLWGASQLRNTGWGDPGWPARMAASLAVALALGAAPAVLSWLEARARLPWPWLLGLAGAAVALAAGPRVQFAGLPVLLPGLLLWAWSGRRAPEGFERVAPALLLGALLLARNAFNCGAHHYGFYLTATALIGYHYAVFRFVPYALGAEAAGRKAVPALAFLLVSVWQHVDASLARYAVHATELVGPSGRWFVPGGNVGPVLRETVRHLASAPRSATVVAVPEGAALGFLAGLRHPIALDTLLPRDLPDEAAERRAVAMFEAARVGYVLAVPRDTTEFGAGPFGLGYGRLVANYLRERYALERVVESADPAAGPPYKVVILRRRQGMW